MESGGNDTARKTVAELSKSSAKSIKDTNLDFIIAFSLLL